MDLNSPSLSQLQVEELLSDPEASRTCQKILDSYASDRHLDPVDLKEAVKPSNAFVSLAIKNGPEGIKRQLEEIDHAIQVVDSLLNKNVINYTSEIIQSFEEVNEYTGKMDAVSASLVKINDRAGRRYKKLLMRYNTLEADATSLERLRKVYLYSLECRRIILFLKGLHKRTSFLRSSVSDFLQLLLIASQCMSCLDRILALDRTDALLKVIKYCEDLKNSIVRKVHHDTFMPLFQHGQSPGFEREMEKRVIIAHVIYKELSVSSNSMLDLIENLVREASSSLNIKEVMAESNYKEWQGLLIAQVSEFLLKYVRNQKSIYFICKCARHSLLEKLDKSDRELIAPFLQRYVHEDPKEPFSLSELYTRRCVGILYNVLSTLNKDERYDVVMIVPQLISLGDSMHAELSHITIPFNMHRFYFKTLCEEYAKSFVSVAAKKIIPVSKMCFLNCMKALPTLEASPTHHGGELNQATLMLMNLPVDNELWHMVREFMEKSKMCPALFKQICAIVASALETVFSNVSQVRSTLGTRLGLSDGGSKITLVKPNDAQILNARLFQYIYTIINGIESKMGDLIPQDSNLHRVLQYGKAIPLVGSWSDEASSTIWHTTSYISVENLEFSWSCHQVNIANKNVVKILNFLKDSYFDLLPDGRYELFLGLASTTVASFLIYALTTWPLNEDDRLILLNSTTELEFTLSEILQAKLPKKETDLLSLFRRIIFLSDSEMFALFSEGSSCLPKDVALLHITCRLMRDHRPPNTCLFKFLNFTSVHFMLQAFRNSLLSEPDPALFENLPNFLSSLNLDSKLYVDLIAHLNGF